MGAFLEGSTQAPLMAILMRFEMTLSYQVTLLLMLGCVMAYFVVRAVNAGAMYDITLRRMAQSDERLRKQLVHDLIQPADTVVALNADVAAMARLLAAYPVKYLYVVDTNGLYQGLVPLRKLSAATEDHALQGRTASDFLNQEIRLMTRDMGLDAAIRCFMEHQGERLPVIQSTALPRLLGVVKKSALLETYARLSV